MNLAKFSGIAVLIPTLVGCGGSDSAPTTVLTKDNLTAVAGEGLLDANAIVHAWVHPKDDGFAPETIPCADGGTLVHDDNGPAPTTLATDTFSQCAQNGVTTDGTIRTTLQSIMTGTTVTSFISTLDLNLTIKSPDFSIVETGEYKVDEHDARASGNDTFSSDGLSIAFSSPGATDKITLSNLTITRDGSLTDAYTVESTRLGGRFRLETEAPIVTTGFNVHPESGQFTILGARGAKLVVTILGTDTFKPPLDQGQVKLELDAGDGAAPLTVYASWDDIEAASLGLDQNPAV
jgi:hypothetical protein